MTETKPDLAELRQDGDTLELADGRLLRLLIAPDDIDPFKEYGPDAYGEIASVREQRENAYGWRERPSGFDGNAQKLSRHDVW